MSQREKKTDGDGTISAEITSPTGPSASESGSLLLAGKHRGLLTGIEGYDAARVMRNHDLVMVCFNADPKYLCQHPLYVFDFDANYVLETSQGPAGTC